MSTQETVLQFATRAHLGQKRKCVGDVPYITHPIQVADFIVAAGGSENSRDAGYLHDTVEDCGVTLDEITSRFGPEISAIVSQVTDDRSTSKLSRKKAQVAHANEGFYTIDSALVKLADKYSNLHDMADNPPTHWTAEETSGYCYWSMAVVSPLLARDDVISLVGTYFSDLYLPLFKKLLGVDYRTISAEDLQAGVDVYYKIVSQ